MKKKWNALFGAAVFGILMTTMSMHAFAGQMTDADAKAKAFEHADVKESSVAWSKVDMDDEDGLLIYEVKFYTKDAREYEYEFLAKDRILLSIKYDAEDAFFAGDQKGRKLTLEQAKKKAAESAGKKLEDLVFDTAEIEKEDGRTVYELKFHTDLAEHECEIDADTGYLLKWEYELSQKEKKPDAPKKVMDLNAAKKAALKHAGLKEKDVVWDEIKADDEDGRLIYEGKFRSGRKEYEFEMDGITGDLLDWDIDDD